jgi:hypothetical protein
MRALAVVLAIASACGKPHVHIAAPRPDLTPDERVRLFGELRSRGETISAITCGSPGPCEVDTGIRLANGTEVHHVEDLLPVLAADSVAAREVDASLASARNAWLWGVPGVAVGIGGGVAGYLADGVNTQFVVGLSVMVVGILVGVIGYRLSRSAERRHARAAIGAYDEGLAKRLTVCVSGLAVVPCAAAP